MIKRVALNNYLRFIIFILAVLTIIFIIYLSFAFNEIIKGIFPYTGIFPNIYKKEISYLRFYMLTGVIFMGLLACLFLILKKVHLSVEKSKFEKEKLILMQQEEIEQQKKIITELTALYQSSLDYNKLKTEFFSNVSHELKTPLSIILGAIQLIEQKRNTGISEESKSNKHLMAIKHNCYRLLRLINNLLDITKMDSGFIKVNMINCNIVYLVEEITQSVVPYAKQKGIHLEFDTDIEEIITAVDIDKIERIILNLLSNAIKFTPPEGKITVRVKKFSEQVIISVKDSGLGIPLNMQKPIFERFKQVNSLLTREFEGSGIGLSIVKSFVELHKGNIKLISAEKKGSEFIVELPITQCHTTAEDPSNIKNSENKIIEAINIEFSDIYSLYSSEDHNQKLRSQSN